MAQRGLPESFRPNAPASEEAVAALQKEVGHKLPSDYRAMLRTTDGGSFDSHVGPVEFFPVARVMPETRAIDFPEESQGIILIGRFAEGDYMGIDYRAQKPCYVSYGLISDATEYRGTTLARMLKSIDSGDPVPEPRTAAAKLKQGADSLLVLAREFGVRKDGRVTALAVRGDLALTGCMCKPLARLWNWRTGEQLREFKIQRTEAWRASISEDNELGLMSFIFREGPARSGAVIIDLRTGALRCSWSSGSQLAGAGFAGNEVIFVTWDGLITIRDPASGDIKRQAQGPREPYGVDISGNLLAIASSSLGLYDIKTLTPFRLAADGTEGLPLPPEWTEVSIGGSRCILSSVDSKRNIGFSGVFLADGRIYASPCDPLLVLMDSKSGQVLSKTRGKTESFWRVRGSDDGSLLVSCGDSSGHVRVWDTSSVTKRIGAE